MMRLQSFDAERSKNDLCVIQTSLMPRVSYNAKIIPRVYVRGFVRCHFRIGLRQGLHSWIVRGVHNVVGEVDKKLSKATFRSSIVA
jgi:hypothetical protein